MNLRTHELAVSEFRVTSEHITDATPMGANLVADGATFRVWAPNASAVYVVIADTGHIIGAPGYGWTPNDNQRLTRNDQGIWSGFVRGVRDGHFYRFYIGGLTSPYKRDPYARELEMYGWPNVDCIVRDPGSFPWHDAGYRTPAFNDLIIYQFHIGRFHAADSDGHDERHWRVGKFLDVIDRIPYLADLGVNAIAPLPVVEFDGPYSLGYNGKDIFSAEMDYAVTPPDLPHFLEKMNRLLVQKGKAPLESRHLEGQVNQLKALVDVCHVYGMAVLLDVVYNHAGGFGDDTGSIFFFDRNPTPDNGESVYFKRVGHAGGLVFDFDKPEVRRFLIDNAGFFLNEYHADGLRYDQVTVIDENGGWEFLKQLTSQARGENPSAIHIAEYWKDDQSWVIRQPQAGGAGFDAVWQGGLRWAVRHVVDQAAGGRDAHLALDRVRDALHAPPGFTAAWRSIQHLENHDKQRRENTNDPEPRVAALADPSNHRSWYARSRARVANGLLLTAPGIPMLFMGQEFLEDKPWSDAPLPENFIWWAGLDQDRHMSDHLRFTRELIALRKRHPALRGEGLNVFYVHESDRVLALHRWVSGMGRDVIIVASLNEETLWHYELGFPVSGRWLEAFNSDVYDHWVNPEAKGNGGEIHAHGPGRHGLPHSAEITLPANSMLVFTRDHGD